ncbi:hypothetical protein GO988_08100 [Hymenobacter sp. HMF4947]|uniref:Uncharacterized protein n=1 Tax=Hymenobacter ginkgonis TaxID=2682976 RepID=A0A7K1TD04_9BACT|nr:hypothetical protein [Hymenobacter ginkgonis]MVN76284.1 hypothetical protein [Hymenobacter ginkgonis]
MNLLQKTATLGAFSLLAFAAAPAYAQVNININTAPPVVVGAPSNAQYYYIPEANAYYDVPARRYLVQRNGKWARYEHLEGYDSRNFHPQYIDYRGDSPWTYNRGGNPHGLPPGQAKKLYGKGYKNDKHDKHDDHGKGHGHR